MPKCQKCGVEYAEDKPHEHKGKLRVHEGNVYCESCLVDLGVPINGTQSYEDYIKLQTELRQMHSA